jgi:ribonuclease Z
MDCIILGAGGMMPMPARLTTSVLLKHNGRMIMFDAGEGIQLALKKGGLGICSLEVVAISHLHADHVLGLPGILMFKAQCESPSPVTITGPKGIAQFVNNTISDLKYRLNFPLIFKEWTNDSTPVAHIWHGNRLLWEPLEHSCPCVGYRFEEALRPGKFDINRARSLNIPPGPLFGQLQSGNAVTLKDGTRIEPTMVVGPKRKGRSMVFATDTKPCSGLEKLCKSADIAFMEGMFASRHQKEADEKKHSTAESSAKIAAKAGVKQLVLVHISPRYSFQDEEILQQEARIHFKNAIIGRGLQKFSIPLND